MEPMCDDRGSSIDSFTIAHSIQQAASREGFDWEDVADVLEKVREEVGEIAEAIEAGDVDHAREELGDLLFAAVNLARFLEADASEALSDATDKFSRRYLRVKAELEAQGRSPRDCSLPELDVVWERVKHDPPEVAKKSLDKNRDLRANSDS